MLKSCLSSPRQAVICGIFSIIMHLVGVVYTSPYLVALTPISHRQLQIIPFIVWIWCTLTVILSVSMIYGVLKKRHKLIAPYIYLGVIGMNFIGLTWVYVFIIFYNSLAINRRQFISLVGPATVITAFQILLWLPVYFLYKALRTQACSTGRIIKLNEANQPLFAV